MFSEATYVGSTWRTFGQNGRSCTVEVELLSAVGHSRRHSSSADAFIERKVDAGFLAPCRRVRSRYRWTACRVSTDVGNRGTDNACFGDLGEVECTAGAEMQDLGFESLAALVAWRRECGTCG